MSRQPLPNEYNQEFIQIGVGFHSELFALDKVGNVWRYYPAREATPKEKKEFGKDVVFARWGKLTSYRMNPESEYKAGET